MNIKPSGQQVEKWIAEASSEGGKILDPNKLAGLVAQWGASQAQQPTIAEPELPEAAETLQIPDTALGRDCGSITKLIFHLSMAKREPGWIVSACWLASSILERIKALGPLYTAAQMHEHYAAGVRAGSARSQDGLPLVISGAIFDFAGFLTTRTNVIEVGSTANASPMADLVKEWAALRGLSLDDAAVLSWQEWLNAAMQGGQQ